jgi:hypothetical protein
MPDIIGGGTTKVKRDESVEDIALRVYPETDTATGIAAIQSANGGITSANAGTVITTPPITVPDEPFRGPEGSGVTEEQPGPPSDVGITPGAQPLLRQPGGSGRFGSGQEQESDAAEIFGGAFSAAFGGAAENIQDAIGATGALSERAESAASALFQGDPTGRVSGYTPADYQSGHIAPPPAPVPPAPWTDAYASAHLSTVDYAKTSAEARIEIEDLYYGAMKYIWDTGQVPTGVNAQGNPSFFIPDEIFRDSGLGRGYTDEDMVEMGWELTPEGRWVYNPNAYYVGGRNVSSNYGYNYGGAYSGRGQQTYQRSYGGLTNWRGNTFG